MKTIITSNLLLLLFIIPNFSWAQYVTVSGYVSNGINGEALENVSIFESNSEIGTITNKNGFYTLVLEKGTYSLKISDNGYTPVKQELTLNSDTTLLVKLLPKQHLKNRNKKQVAHHSNQKTDKELVNKRGW